MPSRMMKPSKETQEIDWVKAAIYERKNALNLNWADIEHKAHVGSTYLRKLMSTKHTKNWDAEVRKAVCDVLGIKIKTVMEIVGNEVELK